MRASAIHAKTRLAHLLLALVCVFIPACAGYSQDTRGTGSRTQIVAAANGGYYALIIGINDYRPPMAKLKTAVADAQAIDRILREKYDFKVKLLLDKDATRDNILDAIMQYRNTLTENDNLLIYYAGHGYSDHDADKAYWLPVDADSSQSSHRIIADDLTTGIKVLRARHVLVISDSCYSGGLSRDANTPATGEGTAFLGRMMASRSRTLMASGGDEPVSDKGTDGHSVFAYAIIKALSTETSPTFTASDLFYSKVRQQVAGKSEQLPQYSVIRNSNHDEGDFVFTRIGAPPIAIAARPASPPIAESRSAPPPAAPPAPSHPAVSSDLTASVENISALSPADAFKRGKTLADGNHFTEALPFFNASCSDHFGAACSYLGYMYSNGAGVTKDAAHAMVLFRKACDVSNASGCYNLGALYTNAGTPADLHQAAVAYGKACDGGFDQACDSLGYMYATGKGVKSDFPKAVALFRSACDAAEAISCLHLGEMYEAGTGVKQDKAQASKLYREACEGSIQEACDNLKRLEP